MANVGGLPGVAQPAMQEGKYVGKLIKARMDGDTGAVPPFKYFDKGSMATIGHKYAVADAFGRKFTGIIAYLMWGFIHVLYLIRPRQLAWHHIYLDARPLRVEEPRPPRYHLRTGAISGRGR